MLIASTTLSTSLLVAALVFLGFGLILIAIGVVWPGSTSIMAANMTLTSGTDFMALDPGELIEKIAAAVDKILRDVPRRFRIGVLLCFMGIGFFVGAIYVESHDGKVAAEKAAAARQAGS